MEAFTHVRYYDASSVPGVRELVHHALARVVSRRLLFASWGEHGVSGMVEVFDGREDCSGPPPEGRVARIEWPWDELHVSRDTIVVVLCGGNRHDPWWFVDAA